MYKNLKKLVLLAVCVMALAASPALAATGDDPYQTNGENLAGTVQGGGGGEGGGEQPIAATGGSGNGSLPFTGLDIALIVGVGGVLLAVGLGTRRLTRHADTG